MSDTPTLEDLTVEANAIITSLQTELTQVKNQCLMQTGKIAVLENKLKKMEDKNAIDIE